MSAAPELPGLPRDDDGPVFREPWEAQAFALAVALHERGVFTWPEWAQALGNLNPLHYTVELVRHAAFGFQGWVDVAFLFGLVVFGVIMWRLAIRAMLRKLID